MNTPFDPERAEADRRMTEARQSDRSEGLGAVIAVVAVAAVILASILYILGPPAETPARVTSEAPGVTTPAPQPKPDSRP